MRILISITFFLLILTQIFQPALASDLTSLKKGYFLLSGEIKSGDAENLAVAFANVGPNTVTVSLTLDSPGGDVMESIRIASLVKALHMSTSVEKGGICASSCFFIFLAGDVHVASGTIRGVMDKGEALGFIGLHRPYLKPDQNKIGGTNDSVKRQHEVMNKVRNYLADQDVPQRLIDIMMNRPSNDIYWMTSNDIRELGDYSPGLEELLISRCSYSRHMFDDLPLEDRSGDSVIVASSRAKLKAFGECSANAFPDVAIELANNTLRLRKGWRPWFNQKIGKK